MASAMGRSRSLNLDGAKSVSMLRASSLPLSSSTSQARRQRAARVAASTSSPSHAGLAHKTGSSRGSQLKTEAASINATAVLARPKPHLASFDAMLRESEVPVLVDFHAQWCGPCQMMSNVLKGLTEEMKGALQVVKIDTDLYPKLASKYRIQGLPTLLLFRDGQAVDRVEGVMTEADLSNRVRYYVRRLDTKFGRR